jgi:hypothetical protein
MSKIEQKNMGDKGLYEKQQKITPLKSLIFREL